MNQSTFRLLPWLSALLLAFALPYAKAQDVVDSAVNPAATPVADAGLNPAADAAVNPALPPITLKDADSRLEIAQRMLQGGIYDRALELADSVLAHPDTSASAITQYDNAQEWLKRREAARFARERARLGLAKTQDDLEDVAEAFVQLSNNRYRLQESAYNVQSAYWAARAYEQAGEYREAVEYYSRVGGVTLPQGMEGDAAQRMSGCLRKLAEEIPYPGTIRDRQRRDRLLNQAINELDRARLAFPVGNRRKEIELDLIVLRMARREEQFIRDAATEAEAYIESDPAKDPLRARAVLYRGQAAAILGLPQEASTWFQKVLKEEAPSPEDQAAARVGLALALMEIAESSGQDEKNRLLKQANEALDAAIAGQAEPLQLENARVIKAQVLLALDQPSAAMDTLNPIIEAKSANPSAWRLAGVAELRRGRLANALSYLYPATRPGNANQRLRYQATADASRTADARRDYGLSLALNHHANRMLRHNRLFSSLLVSEFLAMETILKLGKMGSPLSLSGDRDLLTSEADASVVSIEEKRSEAALGLSLALVRLLQNGGDPNRAYDLAIQAEAADEWQGEPIRKLELGIGMIAHLRQRRPVGVTDSTLSSRQGEARHALALARADLILNSPEPDNAAIDRALGDFAAAADSFQEPSADGFSLQDSLNQGMVNLESGAFLMELSKRWEHGPYAARAMNWREEARLRIEASLRPFNQALSTSGPSSLAARRAKWSRGRALELMGEWRGAAADYLALMNNSELPRILRANAARRWAMCMGQLGENRVALTRLAVFTEIDAEAALLAGHLAEDAGFPREAYQYYRFASDPASPSIPPATPNRIQDAAFHAARLALRSPGEANPLLPAAQVIASARERLEETALADLANPWTIRMLTLLVDSWIGEAGDSWKTAADFSKNLLRRRDLPRAVERALYILSAKAMAKGADYEGALGELDLARELLEEDALSRPDSALIMLETARLYRSQQRRDDALRAYADVYAVYPEQVGPAEDARTESAVMLLSNGKPRPQDIEQARGVLSGLKDQMQAQKIMREYGIH